MKHPFCLLALLCIVICYVQRAVADPRWFRYPIGAVITVLATVPGLGILGAYCFGVEKLTRWLHQAGWLWEQ